MQGERVQSRYAAVRVFLTARPGSYTMMPGGLTRVSFASDSKVVTMQKGGGSKDTWVLADHPDRHFQSSAPAASPL